MCGVENKRRRKIQRREKKLVFYFEWWILLCLRRNTLFYAFCFDPTKVHTNEPAKYLLLQSHCNNRFIFIFTFLYVNTRNSHLESSRRSHFRFVFIIITACLLLLLILRVSALCRLLFHFFYIRIVLYNSVTLSSDECVSFVLFETLLFTLQTERFTSEMSSHLTFSGVRAQRLLNDGIQLGIFRFI